MHLARVPGLATRPAQAGTGGASPSTGRSRLMPAGLEFGASDLSRTLAALPVADIVQTTT